MKVVELRRHTAADADVLTPEGVRAALEIGRRLEGGYHFAVSSGAQRATQTLACFLAGLGEEVPGGVVVDPGFRSERERRWFELASSSGGELGAMRAEDPAFVDDEAKRLGDAVRRVLDALEDGGRALVVGHSPTTECAVLGLTGQIVAPVSKGAGVVVTEDAGTYRVAAAH